MGRPLRVGNRPALSGQKRTSGNGAFDPLVGRTAQSVGMIEYWRNTEDMPRVLRMLCRGGMAAAPLLLIVFLVPGHDFDVNGHPVSYAELWLSRMGMSAALFLGLIALGSWGLAARIGASRWALVAAPIAPLAVFPPSLIPDPGLTVGNAVLTAAVIYGCLFHIRSVQEYIGRSQ